MWGGNHHPASENRDFSATEHPVDSRPVCKLKFVRCGPASKKALSVSLQSWRTYKVQEQLFPNSEIEIFDNFLQNSRFFKKFSISKVDFREGIIAPPDVLTTFLSIFFTILIPDKNIYIFWFCWKVYGTTFLEDLDVLEADKWAKQKWVLFFKHPVWTARSTDKNRSSVKLQPSGTECA